MKTSSSWGLIGFGNIGREVLRQISLPGVSERLGLQATPDFIATPDGIMKSDGETPTGYDSLADVPDLPDVTFVAIPSSDDGKIAYDYILPILKKGKLVITAEKGAVVNHFAELKQVSDNFSRFGITATVGGGTRLLQVVREYCQDMDNITQIHLALNGTLAAMMDWVVPPSGKGIPLSEAAEKAIANKYAEPGSDSAIAILRGEAEGDIPKKTAIFFNNVGLGKKLIDWKTLRFTLSDKQIEQATSVKQPTRFIVSLYSPWYLKNHPKCPEDGIIGGFNVDHEGWRLAGGFRHIDASPLFSPLANLTGPGNGIVIALGPHGSDGIYSVTGPGAGVNPTVNTMLDDFLRLNRTKA